MYISRSALGILVAIIIYCLFLSFEPDPRVLLAEDGSAYFINSSWWGLKTVEREIKLVGQEWQVRNDDGEWSPIMFD